MKGPQRVKPVKAAGGAPSDDELDQFEVLVGLGTNLPADQVQRLIEAARARASPTVAETPTPRLRRRIEPAYHEERYDPPPRRRPPPPPPRRRRRRAPEPQGRPINVMGTVLLGSVVLAIMTPMSMFIFGSIFTVTGKAIPAELYWAAPIIVGFLMIGGLVSSIRQSARQRSRDSPEYDDEEDEYDDDEDQFTRYRDERYQGDNDLNGRHYGTG